MDPASPGPDLALALVDEATDRVLAEVRSLSDDAARAPSGLPDWSRGHVLTHIARNADGLGNLFESARTGEPRYMYVSHDQRAADIAAGSDRPLDELTADVTDSAGRFRAAAEGITDWTATVRRAADAPGMPVWWVPLLRIGELEIHHTDLDVGYGPAQWPQDWVRAYLPYATADLVDRAGEPLGLRPTDGDTAFGATEPAARVVSGPQRSLLAWVVGRHDGGDLQVTPDGPLPALGAWR